MNENLKNILEYATNDGEVDHSVFAESLIREIQGLVYELCEDEDEGEEIGGRLLEYYGFEV